MRLQGVIRVRVLERRDCSVPCRWRGHLESGLVEGARDDEQKVALRRQSRPARPRHFLRTGLLLVRTERSATHSGGRIKALVTYRQCRQDVPSAFAKARKEALAQLSEELLPVSRIPETPRAMVGLRDLSSRRRMRIRRDEARTGERRRARLEASCINNDVGPEAWPSFEALEACSVPMTRKRGHCGVELGIG
jgi:hypothetical protein